MNRAVASAALVGGDDAIERRLLLALTGHADRDSHGDPRLRARQSTQALTGLSTCYMTGACSGALAAAGAALAAAACCSKSDVKSGGQAAAARAAAKPTFTVFALAEVRGQIGPCGCTSDPLGDISRTVQARRRRPRRRARCSSSMPAPLLYSQTPGAAAPRRPGRAQGRPARRHLPGRSRRSARSALGPDGPREGPGRAADAARRPSNVGRARSRTAPTEIDRGRRREGRHVRRDRRGRDHGARDHRPGRRRQGAVAELAEQGAQVVDRARAGAAASATRSKLVQRHRRHRLRGRRPRPRGARARSRVESSPRRSATAGSSFPRTAARCVSRVDVYLRGGAARSSMRSARPRRARRSRARQADRRARRRPREVQGRPSADPDVRRAEAERARRSSPRERDAAQDAAAGRAGEAAASSRSIRSGSTRRSRAACRCRTRSSATTSPPARRTSRPPPASRCRRAAQGRRRRYVGMAACADCHNDAVEVLEEDRARAGVADARRSRPAVRLRVHRLPRHRLRQAGRLEPRRTTTTCATSSARSATARGRSTSPRAARRSRSRCTARPPQDLCATQCHTHEHSDTFQYEAYLRDIVGPGPRRGAAQEARRRPDRSRAAQGRARQGRPHARSRAARR